MGWKDTIKPINQISIDNEVPTETSWRDTIKPAGLESSVNEDHKVRAKSWKDTIRPSNEPKSIEQLTKESIDSEDLSAFDKYKLKKTLGIENKLPEKEYGIPEAVDDFITGFKAEVDPFDIVGLAPTEKELKQVASRDNWKGMAANLTGHTVGFLLGSGVIAAGQVSTLAKSMAGLTWGLYQAAGQEEIHHKTTGEDYNPVRMLFNTVVEVNPFVKYGGKGLATYVKKGLAQAGLTGAQAAAYGGEEGAILLSMALGGFTGASTASSKMSPIDPAAFKSRTTQDLVGTVASTANKQDDVVADAIEILSATHGAKLQKVVEDAAERGELRQIPNAVKAMQISGKKIKRTLTNDNIDSLAKYYGVKIIRDKDLEKGIKFDGFDTITIPDKKLKPNQLKALKNNMEIPTQDYMKHVTGELGKKKARVSKFRDITAQRDPVVNIAQYGMWKSARIKAKEVVRMANEGEIVLKSNLTPSNIFSTYSGFRKIDGLTEGLTNLETTVAMAHKAENSSKIKFKALSTKADELIEGVEKTGIDTNDIHKYIENPELRESLNEASKSALENLTKFFDDVRVSLNEMGLNITHLDNWVHHTAQSAPDLARALRGLLADPNNTEGFETAGTILKQYLKIAPKSREHAIQLTDVLSTMSRDKMAKVKTAKGAFKRKGNMSDIVREKDPRKAFRSYLWSSLESAAYQPVIDNALANITILKGLAKNNPKLVGGSIKYVEEWLGALTGTAEKGIQAKIATGTKMFKNKMYKLIDDPEVGKLTTGLAKAGVQLPELVSFMGTLPYPNLLGLQVRNVIRNAQQPLVLTAPELGSMYGYKLVGNNYVRALKKALSPKEVTEFLQKRNLIDDNSMIKRFDEAGDIIKPLGKTLNAVDKFNEGIMTLYTMSDKVNRYITYNVGADIAKDALSGNKHALKIITNRLSDAAKVDALKALKSNDVDGLGDVIGTYLVNKTQFMYSKHARSALERSGGKLFSMFMKWPTMTAADFVEAWRDKRLMGTVTKYLAPMAAYYGASQVLSYTGGYNDPTVKRMFGKNPTQTMSMGAISAILGMDTPMLIKSGLDVVKSARQLGIELDADKAAKTLGKTVEPFLPVFKPVWDAKEYLEELGE